MSIPKGNLRGLLEFGVFPLISKEKRLVPKNSKHKYSSEFYGYV